MVGLGVGVASGSELGLGLGSGFWLGSDDLYTWQRPVPGVAKRHSLFELPAASTPCVRVRVGVELL